MKKQFKPVAENVYQLVVPQPFFEPTNIYLIAGEKPTIIDLGYCNTKVIDTILNALESIGYRLEDIYRVIYTHPHIDHIGAATQLPSLEKKNAAYYKAVGKIENYAGYMQAWHKLFDIISHRYPELNPLLERANVEKYWHYYVPLNGHIHIEEPLHPGDVISLGEDQELEVVHTPGHCPYHICLYHPQLKILFAGDMVLERGPAVVSLTDGDVNQFLRSLEKLEQLDIERIFPAHGHILYDPQKAIKASRLRIEKQEEKVYYAISHGAENIIDITKFFASNNSGPSPNHLGDFPWLSLSVVITYIDLLLEKGKICVKQIDGHTLYRPR